MFWYNGISSFHIGYNAIVAYDNTHYTCTLALPPATTVWQPKVIPCKVILSRKCWSFKAVWYDSIYHWWGNDLKLVWVQMNITVLSLSTKAWKCNFAMTFPMKFLMKISLPGFRTLRGATMTWVFFTCPQLLGPSRRSLVSTYWGSP